MRQLVDQINGALRGGVDRNAIVPTHLLLLPFLTVL